jgi:signal transduction histidine kinase
MFLLENNLDNAIDRLEIILGFQLDYLSSWVSFFSSGIIELNKSLKGLKERYLNLIAERIKLIEVQDQKCSLIATLIQPDNDVRIYTIEAEITNNKFSEYSDEINSIDDWYNTITTSSLTNSDLRNMRDISTKYNKAVRSLYGRFENIYENVGYEFNPFLFPSIQVELLQGSEYRNFEKLSFGQKSGLILELLLKATNKDVIIIDQPEDNLDASSIVKIIAPTLKQLGKHKQIIIATHNSNLVMRLPNSTLEILESTGEYGYLKIRGDLVFREILTEMLNILEGGVTSFVMKLDTYQDIIDAVAPWETFRKRTISELKSYLAQIQAEQTLLSDIKHEYDHKRLDTIGELIQRLEYGDRKPEPTSIGLVEFLDKISETYCISSRKISISIDEKLRDIYVYADSTHLKLIFINLFDNSFRATQRRLAVHLMENSIDTIDLTEQVIISLETKTSSNISLIFQDNGCGIRSDIIEKLYKERVTDQDLEGTTHGIGGLCIRKWIERNRGTIEILDSDTNKGTKQRITLLLA